MTELWSIGWVRDSALETLGPHGDPRARELLQRALLSVERDVVHWEGTAGQVRAHRVLLGTDPRSLALIERVPSIRDAVCAALATAIAQRPGEVLHEVREYWAFQEVSEHGGYRGEGLSPVLALRDEPGAVHRALGIYLQALGEERAASWMARARVEIEKTSKGYRARVHARPERYMGTHERDAVKGALRVLLQGPERARVQVVWGR